MSATERIAVHVSQSRNEVADGINKGIIVYCISCFSVSQPSCKDGIDESIRVCCVSRFLVPQPSCKDGIDESIRSRGNPGNPKYVGR